MPKIKYTKMPKPTQLRRRKLLPALHKRLPKFDRKHFAVGSNDRD